MHTERMYGYLEPQSLMLRNACANTRLKIEQATCERTSLSRNLDEKIFAPGPLWKAMIDSTKSPVQHLPMITHSHCNSS